jgi:hypothetical protein
LTMRCAISAREQRIVCTIPRPGKAELFNGIQLKCKKRNNFVHTTSPKTKQAPHRRAVVAPTSLRFSSYKCPALLPTINTYAVDASKRKLKKRAARHGVQSKTTRKPRKSYKTLFHSIERRNDTSKYGTINQ